MWSYHLYYMMLFDKKEIKSYVGTGTKLGLVNNGFRLPSCLHEQDVTLHHHMSLVMRKLAFCICENKDTDQLRRNREADQHLCFRYIDSTILYFLNLKFQASSYLLWLYNPVYVGPGRKPRRLVFSQRGSYLHTVCGLYIYGITI